MEKMKMAHSALGKNQRHILGIISDLSKGLNLMTIRFYGGDITNGRRCISIGRECSLFYDIPWEVIDLRHAEKVFEQTQQGNRLCTNCQRTFNRTSHSLIKRGLLAVIPTVVIRTGQYLDIEKNIITTFARQTSKEAIRFVAFVGDASGILRKGNIST